MSKLIEIKEKTGSITRINKMTEAMQVVAVAQLRVMQARWRAAEKYRRQYEQLARRLKLSARQNAEKVDAKVLVYVMCSERGFCGSFNEVLFGKFRGFVREQKISGREVMLGVLGRRGCSIFRGGNIPTISEKVIIGQGFSQIAQNAEEAFQMFSQGKAAEVYLLYNEFVSMMLQKPRIFRFLPFSLAEEKEKDSEIIIEPDIKTVSDKLIIDYLRATFYDTVLQTQLGETAARLLTMRGATENSKEMIGALNLKMNKARQASITIELSEIISSFEILAEEE